MRIFAHAALLGCLAASVAACGPASEHDADTIAHTSAALDSQDTQFALAAAGAIKISVSQEGWVQVTQASLVSAGLAATVDPRLLQLFVGGVEQPMLVVGEDDGSFDAGDTVEFYGVGLDQTFTDTQVYWLSVGTAAGMRLSTVTNAVGAAAPANFPVAVTRQDRSYYFAALLNGDASNFFGPEVNNVAATQALVAHHIDASAAASVTVAVQGLNTSAHAIGVTFDGASLGSLMYNGQTLGTQTFAVSAASLVDGTNTLSLVAQNGSTDVNEVAYDTLTYGHTFAADSDYLKFPIAGGTHVVVTNFTNDSIRAFDTTTNTFLTVSVVAQGQTYRGAFDVGGTGTHTLLAFAADAVIPPAAILRDTPSSWHAPHAGEIAILSNALFIDHIQPLATRRASEQWSVAVIDVQDIYDEYNYGVKTNQAIKDFLQATQSTWTTPPRFAILVGDASLDPRNFLGTGAWDLVPTKLIDTAELETASDDWLVDFNNDNVPQLALGRIPARTTAQADLIVEKILGFGGAADVTRGAVFDADADGAGFTFEEDTTQNEMAVAPLLTPTTFFRSQQSSAAAGTQNLVTLLNTGPFLVNYLGHGSTTVWGVNDLTEANVNALTNDDRLSIYLSMDCLNGFFQDVYSTSMAETMLEAGGAAVAVWASTTLGDEAPQTTMNYSFLSQLTHTSLGEAANVAKSQVTDVDVKRTYVMFGDPTIFGTPHAPVTLTAPIDAATPSFDFATTDGANARDGGTDAAADDGGPGRENSFTQNGCGCSLAPTPAPRLFCVSLLGLLLVWRRRRAIR